MKSTTSTLTLTAFCLLVATGSAHGQNERGKEDPIQARADSVIARFDKDKDGVVTRAEAGGAWARIASADLDEDGEVTTSEMKKAWSSKGKPHDGAELRAKELLARMDADKDGAITKAEAGELWARIVSADLDENGKVTGKEMVAAWSKKYPREGRPESGHPTDRRGGREGRDDSGGSRVEARRDQEGARPAREEEGVEMRVGTA